MNPGSAATALKNANMAVKKVIKNIKLVNSKCEVAIMWISRVRIVLCKRELTWHKDKHPSNNDPKRRRLEYTREVGRLPHSVMAGHLNQVFDDANVCNRK